MPSPSARSLAAFSQGVILGGLIQGITVENGQFAGGHFDWATPFAILCGLALVCGYALLGATWLIMKTEGEVAERARAPGQAAVARRARLHGGGQSLYTPLCHSSASPQRWFSLPNFYFLWPVPLVTGAGGVPAVALDRQAGATCCRSSRCIGLFLLGYLGLVISSYPYLVPPSLTVWDTAAAPASQIFMLIGTVFLLPIILGYVDLHLLAVPRQGEGRRELSLAKRHRASTASKYHCGAVVCACGRTTPQPMRSTGARPGSARSKRAALPARDPGIAP